jgi:hypothetical protein
MNLKIQGVIYLWTDIIAYMDFKTFVTVDYYDIIFASNFYVVGTIQILKAACGAAITRWRSTSR